MYCLQIGSAPKIYKFEDIIDSIRFEFNLGKFDKPFYRWVEEDGNVRELNQDELSELNQHYEYYWEEEESGEE